MANNYNIDQISFDGNVYNLIDNTSDYPSRQQFNQLSTTVTEIDTVLDTAILTDTRNTAGNQLSTSKLYLIGTPNYSGSSTAAADAYDQSYVYGTSATDSTYMQNNNLYINGVQAITTNQIVNTITSSAIENTVPSVQAVKTYVDENSGTFNIQGTIGSVADGGDIQTLPTTGVTKGDAYTVVTADTYDTLDCDVGDIIIATSSTPTWSLLKISINLDNYSQATNWQNGTGTGSVKLIQSTASGSYSTAEGSTTIASGFASHTEGSNTTASANNTHAEGSSTIASYANAHTEGDSTTASGQNAHAEGLNTIANHRSQHVFGQYNVADVCDNLQNARGNYIEIIGNGTSTTRSNARTLDWQGNETLAGTLTVGRPATQNNEVVIYSQLAGITGFWETGTGISSARTPGAAEESGSYTMGNYAIAEGYGTEAQGYAAHAEGVRTEVTGDVSHAEGIENIVNGTYAHAEGAYNTATGRTSHVEGMSNISTHALQHIFGQFNALDESTADANSQGTYIELVGNGTGETTRSNARTLDWNGNEILAGKATVGQPGLSNHDLIARGQVSLGTAAVLTSTVTQSTISDSNNYCLNILFTPNTATSILNTIEEEE